MPLSLLFTFLFAQGAVFFGSGAYFFAMHLGVPEWQQLPVVQEQLRKYSARQLKFTRVYVRTGTVIMVAGTVVCLVFAGLNVYASTGPNARQAALPGDFIGTIQSASVLLAGQALIIVACFVQVWRSRRALRRMALWALQTQKAAES